MSKRESLNQSLDWKPRPKAFFVADELIRSDAWRCLSAAQKDIWLFIMTCRRYPRKNRDYWNPTNKDDLKAPVIAVQDFFNGEARGMACNSPNPDTIRKAFQKFMEVGLLSLVHQGGGGKGDQNIYKLEHAWRTWRKGDPPCFSKAGMSRAKGFCVPESGEFYAPDKN